MYYNTDSFRVGDVIKGCQIEEALNDVYFTGAMPLYAEPAVMSADVDPVRQQIAQNLGAVVMRRVLSVIRTAQDDPSAMQGDYVAENLLNFAVTPEMLERLADAVLQNSGDAEIDALLNGLLSEDEQQERSVLERLMRTVNEDVAAQDDDDDDMPAHRAYANF